MSGGVRCALAMCMLTLVSACAAFVDKADYADYRQVRLAADEEERLLAIQRYVAAHPDGHWHDELNAEQIADELDVYEDGKATGAGLEFYVRAYPRGRFVQQARDRLSVIAQIEQRKIEERATALRVAEEKRVRDEELRRTWVTRFFGYWTDTLLAVRQWGEPIADIARLNPEFSRAFGKMPRPQCNATECVKHYRSSFGVPVPGGTRTERTIELTLRLLLREGRVTRVELLFPRRGFSRWFELENRRAVVDEDPQLRAEAIAWVIEKVKPWLAKVGQDRVELTDLVLEPVLAPTIGPSGEVIDTTAVDPNSQVQGASEETFAVSDTPLGTPQDAQATPDMVIGPIVIPEQGSSVQASEPTVQSPTNAEGAGEIMTLGAIEVGGGDDAQPAPLQTTTPAAAPPAALPVQTYALTSGDLRVILFAESAGGWDGLRIERVAVAPAPAVTPRARGIR